MKIKECHCDSARGCIAPEADVCPNDWNAVGLKAPTGDAVGGPNRCLHPTDDGVRCGFCIGCEREREPIKVGDRVRSYDFPDSRKDCYVEGVVRAIREHEGCDRYVIAVEREVWNGSLSLPTTTEVLPPVNGTPKLFGDVCNGVERIK